MIQKRVFLLIMIVWSLPAQIQAGTTGKITGIVREADGREVLPGVNASIPGSSLGSVTNKSGEFFILNVPPGIHSLQLSFIGYTPVTVDNLVVRPDQTTRVEVALSPQIIDGGSVTITAEKSLIQKDRTYSAANLSAEQIRDMPINSFTEAIALSNGFIVANKGSRDGSQKLYVRGARANEIAYLIDGVYVKNEVFGGAVADVPIQGIQDLEIISGTFNAEYGEAMSAVVNIVTKEGSPEFQGLVQLGSDEIGIERYDNNTRRIEASLGGPIGLADGTFFIAANNLSTDTYLHEFKTFVHDLNGNPITRIHHPLTFYQNERYTAKLVLHPSIKSKTVVSCNRYFEKQRPYDGKYKEIPDHLGIDYSSSHLANLTHTRMPAPKTFYTLRCSWFRHSIKHELTSDLDGINPPKFNPVAFGGTSKNEYYGPYLHHVEYDTTWIPRPGLPDSLAIRSDSVYVQSDGNFWMDYTTDEYAFMGEVTSQVHRYHLVKAGMEYKSYRLRDDRLMGINALGTGVHSQETHYRYQPVKASAYLQDKMEAGRFIVNAGIRGDYLDPKAIYAPDLAKPLERKKTTCKMQISPRLGIAYVINDRLHLHFGWGHFCQFPDFHMMFRRTDMTDPEGPVNLTRGVPALIGNANLKAQRTVAYEFGSSLILSPYLVAHLTVFHKDIKDYLASRFFHILPNPYLAVVNLDYARTRGIELSLQKHFSGRFAAAINYTWSRSEGNGEDWLTHYYNYLSTSTNGEIPIQKMIRPKWDKPHVLNFQMDIQPAGRWEIHLVGSISSGQPYTPVFVRGEYIRAVNSERMPYYASVDLRVNKKFQLFRLDEMLFINIWNLLDRENVYAVFSDTGRPDYTTNPDVSEEYMQEPNRYGPPRMIEAGLQIGF